jgi:Tfp pilus assembly protein PilF
VLQEGQKIHQHSPRFLLALGRVYLAGEQYAQANDALNQMIAVTTSKDNPLVLELAALIATKEKNWPIAKANYEKLYSQEKKSRWLVNIAQAAWESGDQNSAIMLLKKRAESNKNDVITRSLLANYLLKSGQADAAKVEYQALIKDMPSDAMSLNNLAWILKDTDPKMAKSLAEKALALKPNDTNIQDTLNSIKS